MMSEATETKPAVEEAKPEVPEEKPLNVDALSQSTSRFTRKAWNFFLPLREDLDAIKTKRFDISLEARSEEGAQTLNDLLNEHETPGVKRSGKTLTFRSTFEKLQTVIKHEQVHLVDMQEPLKV